MLQSLVETLAQTSGQLKKASGERAFNLLRKQVGRQNVVRAATPRSHWLPRFFRLYFVDLFYFQADG